ncbi:fe(2+) transport protein 1-like isoform X2 [Solanum tuberosum]|uniref:fe(2+) transport protein 1-like isoform X2 n=1 Tax=Solanum tuberosum TaxID=4113 RepID=UPI0003D282BD|nr:PREDICTED: fe(2+) transport protein 1-like isoform X2 [Solanum tuberosum]
MIHYNFNHIVIFFVLISILVPQVSSVVEDCGPEQDNSCVDKSKALPLKIIAIISILITSIIGVWLPLVTRSIPALSPDRSLFVIVKAFASGIILGTGFMHVLPDSFDMLSSSCLKENPWHKFPFTGFVAMLSAIVTMAIDSISTSLYSKKHRGGVVNPEIGQRVDLEMGAKLLRYRVIAMLQTIHLLEKAMMAFFFSVTTPFGIAIGIALSNTYRENSPRALIIVGLLNASSAGLLIYMALVDLLAADFMGDKLQGSVKLQIKSYMAVLLGAGGMSLMAKWA